MTGRKFRGFWLKAQRRSCTSRLWASSVMAHMIFCLEQWIQDPNYIWLVVQPPLSPLWKIWVRQLGWLETQSFWENKIHGNQTTNQNYNIIPVIHYTFPLDPCHSMPTVWEATAKFRNPLVIIPQSYFLRRHDWIHLWSIILDRSQALTKNCRNHPTTNSSSPWFMVLR